MDHNSTLPTTISSIHVVGADNTRRSFIDNIFSPLLASNNSRPFTLSEALHKVHSAADKLRRFDIFKEPIEIQIDKPDKTDPSSTPTDLDVCIKAKELPRVKLQTGTDVGNTEGSAYVSLLWRNLFGGAESLNINGSYGTRTRSSYNINLTSPLLSNPDLLLDVGGVASSTQNTWASHEEVLKSGWARLRWLSSRRHRHDISYDHSWRQITGLASNASPTIRAEAGDSVKSGLTHTWVADHRDNPLLPQSGTYIRTVNELAGGLLQGDVNFWKSTVETQAILPIPLPGVEQSGVTLTGALRGGLIYPLFGQASRLSDRFTLGGPNDVRGFRQAGLGPRDRFDSVGGDVFAAASVNLLFPVPGVGPQRPLRGQFFINGGRLLALQEGQETQKRLLGTIEELGNGLPSTSAGVGLVYAHPIARFELNFSLPLIVRKGEDARKGFSFGIGMNFM